MANDPVFGSFKLDAAQSTGTDRCILFSLEDYGNGKFRYVATRINADEMVNHQDGIFAFDGADHPDGVGGSLAFTRIDDQRYAVVSKGSVNGTAMRTVSGDTVIEVANGTEDGTPFNISRVYTRNPGRCAR